jgi:hypothetical protein
MSQPKDKLEFLSLTEQEETLFNQVLADNKHLSETHYVQLFAWCKLATRIANIETPTREDLKYIGEFRLLSNALRLNPTKAQEVTTDLALQLQQEVTGD